MHTRSYTLRNVAKSIKNALLFATIILGLTSCTQTAQFNPAKQAFTDDSIIQVYVKKNHIAAIKDPSGLYYQVLQQGTGINANPNSTVTVNYEGILPDGAVFDKTTDRPLSFPLSGVIPGWTKGIPLVKAGGKIRLLIPSALGYGNSEAGSIPANSVLIFTIDVLGVK